MAYRQTMTKKVLENPNPSVEKSPNKHSPQPALKNPQTTWQGKTVTGKMQSGSTHHG